MSAYRIHAIGDQIVLDRHDGLEVARTHFDVAGFRRLMVEGLDALEMAENKGLPPARTLATRIRQGARRLLNLQGEP